jgi:dTDP-4-amino-4,6-dideoxygalactose transaminase
MNSKPIYVTQPHLPPLEEFIPLLEQIWASRILTNAGPFHKEFETALCNYLGVEHISIFVNGTLALVTALQALNISGEVITTPYSFVATAHSLLWNAIKPVFVDIDPDTLNLDPARIEAAITPDTTAVMPVHCYGTPCNVEEIQRIADKYHLKVIYDAAQAFGVCDAGGSILRHGDLSVLSFHATKVFNTLEGGAIICPDAETKKRIDYLKNFGFANETTVVELGINGKMNEMQSALGILQLKHIDAALAQRKQLDTAYREALSGISGITVLPSNIVAKSNNSFFPLLVESGFPLSRNELYTELKKKNIFARRYFYPLISEFPMYQVLPSAQSANLPVAHEIAKKILCLPIYPTLSNEDQDYIISTIKGA